MVSSENVIGRPSKYHKLVDGLNLYLAQARANSALPLSILAIARVIGVKKSTIYHYQHEPKVAELLSSIRTLAAARKIAIGQLDELGDVGANGADTSGKGAISDLVDVTPQSICLEVLAIQASSAVQKVVWSMGRFTGRHRKHRYVSDLPRIVYDLDVTLAELHRSRQELNSLSDEWRQSQLSNSEVTSGETQLSLTDIFEEQYRKAKQDT
jgi:hypothetical protein